MKRFGFRGVSVCLITALVAPTPIAPAALAQGARLADGSPTPELCANLGFRDARRYEDVRAYAVAPNRPPAPAPAPRAGRQVAPSLNAPPPPPPPPPARPAAPTPLAIAPVVKEQRVSPPVVESLTVTGERRAQIVQGLPVAPYGYGSAQAPAQPDTERYPQAVTNAVKQVATDPVSTFSIDVDTAAYSNVRRFLAEGQRPPRDAVRVEELVNYFDYNYRAPETREPPFATYLAVAPSPWAKGKELIHIGVQGFKPPVGHEPPLNLVFLVDTSGSMMPADRLPLAQKSLNVLIDQLRPQDRVSLVAYAGSAGAVLGPTDGRDKLKIRCAVEALQSGGSTAGGAGLSLAYALAEQNFDKQAVNRVILMTDGDFNVGVTDNKRLEDFVADKRKTGIYLSVYGFGRGNYQDARMQTIAQNGNGAAAYVDSFDEARKLFRDDFSKSLFPIADDVKIQVEFNPAEVAEYRLIGYETRLLKREDFNNDAIDAGEVNAGASVTALYEVTPVGGPLSVDSLRYSPAEKRSGGRSDELAFLKIRYKAPGGQTSKLISQPIGRANSYASVAAAPEATRWATAVAAYGQKLRGDPYMAASFGWDDVVQLAQGARGEDPMGVRAQFVQLARSAKDVQTRTELGALSR